MTDIEKIIHEIETAVYPQDFSESTLLLHRKNKIILDALNAQQERDNPQPLTLEQLKERVGKPVYIVEFSIDYDGMKEIKDKYWKVSWLKPNNTYSTTWLAYDHESKGGLTND